MDQLHLFADRDPVRVVVLEDDPRSAALLRRRLFRHAARYEVQCLTHADLNNAECEFLAADAVVLGLGGSPESLTTLRWLSRYEHLAVVALHHGAEFWDDLDAVVTGAQDVLPFEEATTARLDRVIRAAIARKRAESAALASALSDPVTGMASRSWMLERLDLAVRHAATCSDGWHVALLFCDLDRFKAVNDSLGHAKGDELLRLVADRLNSVVRTQDPVTRFGGDEFVILLEGHRIEGLAHRVGLRALGALSQPFVIDGHQLHVGCSIGLALLQPGDNAADLLDQADMALYRAKRRGRGRIEVFDQELRAFSDQQRGLVGRLRDAIRTDELSLEQMPIWDLRSGAQIGTMTAPCWAEVSSAHALVDLAVRHGVGPDLGRWLIRRSLRVALDESSLPSQILIDVPPGLAPQPSFVTWVEDELASSGIDPARLVLAISEAELSDTELVRPVLDGLDHLGVSVALSSFGSGAASLALFGSALVDEVVLAPNLVADIAEDHPRRAVVEGLLRIGDAIGQRLIASGPRTIADVEALAVLGCDAVATHLPVQGIRRETASISLAAAAVEDSLALR